MSSSSVRLELSQRQNASQYPIPNCNVSCFLLQVILYSVNASLVVSPMTFWPFHSAPILSSRNWPSFLLLTFQCYLLSSLWGSLLGQISKLDPCMCIIFTWLRRPPIILRAGDHFSCLHMQPAAVGLQPSWVWAVPEGSSEVWLQHAVTPGSGNTVRRRLSCFTEGTLVWQDLWSQVSAWRCMCCFQARHSLAFVQWCTSPNTSARCTVVGLTFVAQIICNIGHHIIDNWELGQWVLQACSRFWCCTGCYFAAVQAAVSAGGISASLVLFPLLPMSCHPFSCANTTFQDFFFISI